MIIQTLSLKDFRSHSEKKIYFSDKKNLIVGPNTSGKTNILEAIYLLATGKSFRVKGVENEMIRYGEWIGRVRGEIRGEGGKEELEIILTRGEVLGEKVGKKKYLINGVAKRALDFVGNLRAVYFGPEDLQLITDSPSLRRKYLDLVLSLVDREYYRALLSYEKGLRARNKLLEIARETGEIDKRRFYFWDQLLIRNGNLITVKREEFLKFLNSSSTLVQRSTRVETGEGLDKNENRSLNFKAEYERSTISAERLAQYAEEEVAAGVTLVGPQRDDFKVRIKGNMGNKENEGLGWRDLSVFGSRGEQRLATLWLKLGELEFVKSKTEDQPILLLDDVFSELDLEYRKLVFQVIDDCQTIMTTTDLGIVEREWLEGVKITEL